MAQFGWAYVDCAGAGGSGSYGPPNSLQFVTASGGATTGSLNLTFVTGAAGESTLPSHILYLTGTLIVSDTISASHYHIADVTEIDSTGSTYFGNTNDDVHIRTGSLTVSKTGWGTDKYILSASAHDESVRVRGFGGNYHKIIGAAYTVTSADYILGVVKSQDVTISLPAPSSSNTGRIVIVKDEMVSRGTGSIKVTGSVSGFLIDNTDSYVLTGALPSISLYSNGSNWFIF
tara:strand:+ start:120 stop:815 length:696 start_codon:yes stop_codon:yes gene_type:complete